MNRATRFFWSIFALAAMSLTLFGQTVPTTAPPQPCDASKPWQWLYNFPDNGQGGSYIKVDAKTLTATTATNINPALSAFAIAVRQYLLAPELKLKGQKAGKLVVWRNCATNEIRHEFAVAARDAKEWKPQVAKAAARPTKVAAASKAKPEPGACPADHTLAYRFPSEAQAKEGKPLLLSQEALFNPDNVVPEEAEWMKGISIALLSTNATNVPLQRLQVCRNNKTGAAQISLDEVAIRSAQISKKRAIIGMALGSAPSFLAFANPYLGSIGLVSGPLVSWLMGRGGHGHSGTIDGRIEYLPYYTGMPDPQGLCINQYERTRRKAWGI